MWIYWGAYVRPLREIQDDKGHIQSDAGLVYRLGAYCKLNLASKMS